MSPRKQRTNFEYQDDRGDTVSPELNIHGFDLVGSQHGRTGVGADEGDGAMLGRVLIYAIVIAIVVVVVTLAIWK